MSQQFIGFVQTLFVPACLMLIMFSMGLTLALRDFVLVLRGGKAVIGGLGGQLVLLPILGLAVALLFPLSPELALGVFIISICPAGTTSNALTFVGRGNVALAVVLTALSSLVTVFSIPFLLSWAIPFFLGSGGDVPTISIPQTIVQLFLITVVPVALGMVVHRYWSAAAARLVHWLRPMAFVLMVAVIAFSVAISLDMVLAQLVGAGPAMWTLNVLATLAGLLIGRAIGAGRRDSMTLAIEVGVQNASLAIFLTLTVLGSLPLAVTQNIYGVVMLLNGSILIRLFRARLRADEARAVA
ncbi:bile acid:sodium symporter family protein [Sphingosinicella terrae]|jgi:bile acid:Na+ symporter, BASS family|uniref:bile acid:sodium symporter family protein n=1 Tax=Sphingosinicella terrae TaxID=2172047 RepID=UPI000E0DF610|nr:bile acid:sodium symporter family protein [Sphingosinicella terrae]